MTKVRLERDTLGEVEVPLGALFGAQTARAVENFPISGWRMPEEFLQNLVLIKKAYAVANGEAGLLSHPLSNAIVAACEHVLKRDLWEQFPVDVFQTGSGTSTNMNVNEVLARLASNELSGEGGEQWLIHPNDHVNLGQSSNDLVPSAARLMVVKLCEKELLPAAANLAETLGELARRQARSITLGRTHLMDALPTTYGRVFSAWQERVATATARVKRDLASLHELPLGGTAVGSGVGGSKSATQRAVELLKLWTGLPLVIMANPAKGIQAWEDVLTVAEGLAHMANVLLAISQDLRLRSSGPIGGLGELLLPAVQPGSSLMPGKVNPVIPEAVSQACIQVIGLSHACTASATLAQLDLFHGGPLVVWNVHVMTRLLQNSCRVLVARCLLGLSVNEARCRELASRSPALATALAKHVGYERAAEVVKVAEERSLALWEVGREMGVPEEALAELRELEQLAGVE